MIDAGAHLATDRPRPVRRHGAPAAGDDVALTGAPEHLCREPA